MLLLFACTVTSESDTSQPASSVQSAVVEAGSTTTPAAETTTTTPTTIITTTTTSTSIATTTTTTTAQPAPPNNQAPVVEILSPEHLSSHQASFDPATQRFGASVSLAALVSDPDGDQVTVEWISSDEGVLGIGESLIAVIHTGEFDAAQPQITARATDQWDAVSEATVQIIVWIPSDT